MELGPNVVASWKGRIGQLLVVATITGVVGLSAVQSASRTTASRPLARSHAGHRAIEFNAPGPTTGSSTSSPTGQSHTSGTKAAPGTTGVNTTTTMDMANMTGMNMTDMPPATADRSNSSTTPSQSNRTNPPTPTTRAATNVTTPPSTPSTQPSAGTTNRNGGTFCNGWIHRVPAATNLTIFDTTNDRSPTAGDCANAHNFYNAVLASTAQFSNINIAIAAGYRPGSDAPGTITRHYVYWKGRSTTADPNQPQGLMYKFDAAGHATFLGAYYFANAGSALPQPAGPLTVWHSHMPNALRMLHIWTFAGVRDPFALMLSGA